MIWFCTGSGAHDRAEPTALGVSFPAIPGRRSRRQVGLELQCPVCGLGPKKLGYKVQRRLEAAGFAEVDISALPF